MQKVYIDGDWRDSAATSTFQSRNPATTEPLPEEYPVSPWSEIEQALRSADAAFREVQNWPGERFAAFLETYANEIEAIADELVESAHAETALPVSPRLRDGELPRTTDQLRQAAAAAREGSWRQATIDTKTNIRSRLGSLGPVAVFGPNNFPFAFNSIAGGDFAAAVAAGNPVIAKGHSSHPKTTRLFCEAAARAAEATEMPAGFVQLIYRTSHEDEAKLVGHPLLGASGYTGSRSAGLVLKEAADRGGNPIYLELSSINPVFILAGALQERMESVVDEFVGSCLMGTGQFCTNPGLVVLPAGDDAETFIQQTAAKFDAAGVGTMLGEGVQKSFLKGVSEITGAGASVVTGGAAGGGTGYSCRNTLLRADGETFLKNAEALQSEAFGNASLMITARDTAQMAEIAGQLEGNLTGTVYSHTDGADDEAYATIEPSLRQRVGRLLNDKMPTGVAVSPAMNHGGPYPATGHPGFTAVGIPAAMVRFGMLQCYDNVRPGRLPVELQDRNPQEGLWRRIDGVWTTGDVH